MPLPSLRCEEHRDRPGIEGSNADLDPRSLRVALSGDTALVGAPTKTAGSLGQTGAAYVFVRSGTTWTQQAELTVSDAAARDRLGSAVALEDDTAVIGAPGRHGFIGASYIFGRRAQLAH